MAMTPMVICFSATSTGRSSRWLIATPPIFVPTFAASLSIRAPTVKPTLAEAGVVGEGLAQVAHPDDDAGPVVGEAQLTTDLEQQVVDVVAHTPRAVAPEVREVLADLRGVHAGHLGQPLRRDRGQLGVGELLE